MTTAGIRQAAVRHMTDTELTVWAEIPEGAGRFPRWLFRLTCNEKTMRAEALRDLKCGDDWLGLTCEQPVTHAGTCSATTKYGGYRGWYGKNYDQQTGRYDFHLGRRDERIDVTAESTPTSVTVKVSRKAADA